MNVKLDENMPRAAIAALAGQRASTVLDQGLGGCTDAHLAAVCASEDRLLITLDRGFGDIRTYVPGTHPGIVVLRPKTQSVLDVCGLLQALLAAHDLELLRGCLVVVEDTAVRIRRPA